MITYHQNFLIENQICLMVWEESGLLDHVWSLLGETFIRGWVVYGLSFYSWTSPIEWSPILWVSLFRVGELGNGGNWYSYDNVDGIRTVMFYSYAWVMSFVFVMCWWF